MRSIALACLLLLAIAAPAVAQDQLELDPEVRIWFQNPDGSCVQCSIGMCGVWCNNPNATCLLWDTPYGPKERGGSGPSRVERYCERRGIAAYNVTGSETYDWMRWAARTGRMTAIGCFSNHFQTLFWHNPDPADPKPWRVCNNNSPRKINAYTDAEFRRHHQASGKWIVILKTPAPPAYPIFAQWW